MAQQLLPEKSLKHSKAPSKISIFELKLKIIFSYFHFSTNSIFDRDPSHFDLEKFVWGQTKSSNFL